MNTTPLKSGFLTSEFYVAVVNDAVGVAVVLNYLTPQQADSFSHAVVQVIGGLMVIFSTVVYMYGRYKLKSKALASGTAMPPLPMNTPSTSPTDSPALLPL